MCIIYECAADSIISSENAKCQHWPRSHHLIITCVWLARYWFWRLKLAVPSCDTGLTISVRWCDRWHWLDSVRWCAKYWHWFDWRPISVTWIDKVATGLSQELVQPDDVQRWPSLVSITASTRGSNNRLPSCPNTERKIVVPRRKGWFTICSNWIWPRDVIIVHSIRQHQFITDWRITEPTWPRFVTRMYQFIVAVCSNDSRGQYGFNIGYSSASVKISFFSSIHGTSEDRLFPNFVG